MLIFTNTLLRVNNVSFFEKDFFLNKLLFIFITVISLSFVSLTSMAASCNIDYSEYLDGCKISDFSSDEIATVTQTFCDFDKNCSLCIKEKRDLCQLSQCIYVELYQLEDVMCNKNLYKKRVLKSISNNIYDTAEEPNPSPENP